MNKKISTMIFSLISMSTAAAVNLPPVVQITSPSNDSLIANTKEMIFKINASDDQRLRYVELRLNGRVLCRDRYLPYECKILTSVLVGDSPVVEAMALDYKGLKSYHSITLRREAMTVSNPPPQETCSLAQAKVASGFFESLNVNQMTMKTWNDPALNNPQSDGTYLFGYNSTDSHYVNFPKTGYYVFDVEAKYYSSFSYQSENPYPKLQVSVNGRVVSEADVNSTALSWFRSSDQENEVEAFLIPAGTHLVSVSAGNWSKELNQSNYQNLFARELRIFEADAECSPLPVVPDLSSKDFKSATSNRPIALGTVLDTGICIQGLCLNVFKDDPKYHDILKKFNHMTPGSVFLMDRIAVAEGVYDFSKADEVVNFAVANGMSITFGHLVWHLFVPQWLVNKNDPAYTKKFLTEYITKVMTRYKGKIKHWVVVNEALDDYEGTRNSFWRQQFGGDGYIEAAFRTARSVDPNANLLYNDYDIDEIGRKSDAAYELVKSLLARGVPVDRVGLQGHFKTDVPLFYKSLVKNMERFAQLGLKIQMSEVDVGFSSKSVPGPVALEIQAQYYRNTLKACLKVEACELWTVFGTADKYWWGPLITPPLYYGSIMNDDYSPKPAYIALMKVLYGWD